MMGFQFETLVFNNLSALLPRLEASAYIDNIVEFGSLFR